MTSLKIGIGIVTLIGAMGILLIGGGTWSLIDYEFSILSTHAKILTIIGGSIVLTSSIVMYGIIFQFMNRAQKFIGCTNTELNSLEHRSSDVSEKVEDIQHATYDLDHDEEAVKQLLTKKKEA